MPYAKWSIKYNSDKGVTNQSFETDLPKEMADKLKKEFQRQFLSYTKESEKTEK